MKRLYEYFGKDIKLIDSDDKTWEGFVSGYVPAGDIEDDQDEFITLRMPGVKGRVTVFYPSDIKSIEEVD